jgi:hypothetical protein
LIRAALLLLLVACNSETYVVVTVSARPAVHDVTALQVTQANNSTTRTDTLQLGTHTLPATFSLSDNSRSGELDLTINGVTSDGTVVGTGATTTTFDTAVALQLDPADFVVNTDYAGDEFLTTDFETPGYQLGVTTDLKWTAAFRNTCTDSCNVFARTFGDDGLPIKTAAAAGTNAYQISSTTTLDGAYPAIAGAGTSTVAVWDFSDTVGGGTGIACRAIDTNGALTAGQRTLSTDAADTATIASLPTGNVVVSWQIYSPAAAIHTIITKPDCTTLTAAPVVVTATTSTDGPYRSTMAANGAALLYAWVASDSIYTRSTTTTATTFTAAEALLASPPTGMTAEAVRLTPMGTGFAAAIKYVSTTDGNPGQLMLQRLSTTGAAVGAAILISDKTGSDFTTGRRGFGIATRTDGATLIVWQQCDDGSASECDGRLDVYGRVIGATGDPVGDPFVIPTTTLGSQTDPSVVALDDAFAVAWTDDSQVAPDTDGTAVRARVIYPTYP